jgi:quinol monooxygenase YgiN
VLTTVEYRVPAEQASNFIEAMDAIRSFRRREGAVRWDLFRDLADPDRYLETFVVPSWAEHLRQHARVTVEDEAIEARFRLLQPGVLTVAAHLIAVRPDDGRTPMEPPYTELS